ncbi:MAG: hypothetical protein ACR2GK_07450 [Gemmatimonadaceae bacterium]
MPDTGIFLIQDGGGLLRLSEQPYDSEDLLQQLLAQYPEVLAGEDHGGQPRKWLLVKREMAVPGDPSGSPRWSLDHLFLDQTGIPTLVEVKRSSDTRLRREVVGQMLDYAANAVAYWPVERLEADFHATARSAGNDPEALLMELAGDQGSEAFWQRVKTNLQAGKVRLVFVADEIPVELRRIVEFLNEQMDPAEVIAVEVRQFVGQGVRSLVPRVIGQTVEAQTKKAASSSHEPWTPAAFLARVRNSSGDAEAEAVQRILDWAAGRSIRVQPSGGSEKARLYLMFDFADAIQYTFAIYHASNPYVEFQFPNMRPPFKEASAQAQLISRVEDATGAQLGANPKFPKVRLSELMEPAKLERLLGLGDWIIEQTINFQNGLNISAGS